MNGRHVKSGSALVLGALTCSIPWGCAGPGDGLERLETELVTTECLSPEDVGAAPSWQAGIRYERGDRVSFGGDTYEARRPHVSLADSAPEGNFALWQKPTPCGVTAWELQTFYVRGSVVTVDDGVFRARRPQLSDEPPEVFPPDRWELLSSCETTTSGECTFTVDEDDPFTSRQVFSTSIVCGDHTLSFERNIVVSRDDGTFSGQTIMRLSDSPLLDLTVQGNPSLIETRLDYSPPIQGVNEAVFSSDGEVIQGVVDGRDIVPIPVTDTDGTLEFQDGQPAPAISLDDRLAGELAILQQKVAADAASLCTTEPLRAYAHDSNEAYVRGPACEECSSDCDTEAAICEGLAVGSCFFTFGVGCVVGTIGCTADFSRCHEECQEPGGDCCPVACDTGACCDAGETCTILDPSGPCCPTGQACGSFCCGANEQCADADAGRCCIAICSGPARACFDPGTEVCDPAGNSCDELCNGSCCPNDGVCIDNGCCDADKACGSVCCGASSECIDGACCDHPCGFECCAANEVCAPGNTCIVDAGSFGVEVRATGTTGINDPVDICGNGTGFTPGGAVLLEMEGIPSFSGPTGRFVAGSATADAAGLIGFDLNSSGTAFVCPPEQLHLDVTVYATDLTTGMVASGTFPGNYYCLNVTMARDFNGGCD